MAIRHNLAPRATARPPTGTKSAQPPRGRRLSQAARAPARTTTAPNLNAPRAIRMPYRSKSPRQSL